MDRNILQGKRIAITAIDLEQQEDLMRSWTEENILGEKDIFNALHIRQPHKIAVIDKL